MNGCKFVRHPSNIVQMVERRLSELMAHKPQPEVAVAAPRHQSSGAPSHSAAAHAHVVRTTEVSSGDETPSGEVISKEQFLAFLREVADRLEEFRVSVCCSARTHTH